MRLRYIISKWFQPVTNKNPTIQTDLNGKRKDLCFQFAKFSSWRILEHVILSMVFIVITAHTLP